MASPQTQNGFIRIANELWDAVLMRDFSKRQMELIWFILRLSYGCQDKNAYVPKMKDFEICGIQATKIKEELTYLEKCRVLFWDRSSSLFEINKDHSQWYINPVKRFHEEDFSRLIHLNLAKKASTSSDEDFPKKEEKLPEKGTNEGFESDETSQKGNNELPKKGTVIPFEPNQDKASQLSKDSIKDIYEEEYMTAMDAYTYVFKKLSYTGFIQDYVLKLLKAGIKDSFIREIFLTMGENGVTEPNLAYMKKVVEDWTTKGITSRQEARKMREGANHNVQTSGSSSKSNRAHSTASQRTAISTSDVDDFIAT